MSSLILHVGMHKTGSSAIQRSFAASIGEGYVYPVLGHPPFKQQHTDALIQLFSSNSHAIRERYRSSGKNFRPSDDDERRIIDAAREAGNGKVILSSEGAYTFLSESDLRDVVQFSDRIFEDIRIIGYVRDPITYISSAFQQRIKSARLCRFEFPYKRYRNFEKFDRVLGRERVILRAFDRDKFPEGDVVKDFSAQLGLVAPPSMQVNRSLSRPAVSAIYRMNRALTDQATKEVTRTYKSARSAIIQKFPHESWPTFRLSPKVLEPLIATNEQDLIWIEERLGHSLRRADGHGPSDVTDERDLLSIEPAALDQLLSLSETLTPAASAVLRNALRAA